MEKSPNDSLPVMYGHLFIKGAILRRTAPHSPTASTARARAARATRATGSSAGNDKTATLAREMVTGKVGHDHFLHQQ